MSLNQDPNRFLGVPPTIPPLPLLHPRRPERHPPAIPLRLFRSNPTHFPATESQALQSGDSESGHLRSPTSEIREVRKLPFFSWRSWPWQSDTAKDRLELYLEQFQSLDSRIGDLQHDYSRFKNKPSPELFEVFLQLVYLNVFKPLPNQPHIHHSSDQRQNPLQTNSWSDFRSDLKIGESDVLTVCMISFTVNDKIRKLFSFKDKIFVTDASRLRRKYKALSLSALLIVAEEWSLPKNVLEACFNASRFQRRMFTPFTTFRTKHKGQFTEFTLNKPDWISMEFCWHSKVPEYKRSFWDFDIYIWRPQVDRPERERVKLFINGASDCGWQLLMIWRPTERASTGMLDRYTQQRVKQLQEQFDSPHSNETEIISSLFSLYTLIINDTETFLDSLVEEIANLTLEGRRKPTASKINFLLHLDDHRQESCIGLRDASTVLEEISTWMNANPDRLNAEYGLYIKLHRWCKQIRRDLKRLQDALLEIKDPLANVQAMTKDQIDLQQISLTAILTFLAAIYLPFSLISGMFGMNVKDPLFPSTSKPLNGSVSSSQTSTAKLALRTSGQLFAAHIAHRAAVDTTGAATTSSTSSAAEATSGSNFSQEQTDAIVSAIMEASSSPSPHLWSFAQFLYISFALSATTIILPIIAGPIFRVTLRSFYQYKVYWRLAVFVFVFPSTIVLDIYIPPLPFEVVFGAPQVVFSLYKLAQARFRGRQKKRWTGYATLLGFCIAIDEAAPGSFGTKKFIHYSQNVGLVAFLPPLYLFAIWMQTDPPMLSNSRLLSWKERLPFTKLSRRQKARPHKSRHLRIFKRICTVCAIIGLNATLSVFLPGVTYAVATSIPFGLFALDQFLTSMGKRMNLRGRLQWGIFLVVVVISAEVQVDSFGDFVGISALLPSLYLWIFYYGLDQIKAWSAQRRRGLNGSQLPSQNAD